MRQKTGKKLRHVSRVAAKESGGRRKLPAVGEKA